MSDMYVRDEETGHVIPHGQTHTQRLDGTWDVGFHNNEPSLTDQQFEAETNVNNIMKKHMGSMDSAYQHSLKTGVYADLTNITDYQSMLETVRHAQEAFDTLPAQTRFKFENDPAKLISFLSDPKNKDEALSLGLIQSPALSDDEKTQKNNDYLAGKISEAITKARPKKGSTPLEEE